MKLASALALIALSWTASPSFAWDLTSETDDFTDKTSYTLGHMEGGFIFFFNCTSGEPQSLDLRIATTMNWEEGLKETLDVQFKGPGTPLVSVTTTLTANQNQKVLLVSASGQQTVVLQLMKEIAPAKQRMSFRISEDSDSTKVATAGFQKAYRKLVSSCELDNPQAL